ncbi:IS3 family transposase [Alkalihalobacillus sp. LMS39]|uniref:IS3 family transposase n=1 Tax=Alkalihalobacillus sp. LMS39 TaxID=2924032 RepID=UPI001FB56BF4|nr:IS3 family transposase [Alkalihalobacillus sp. LMS39]UOE94815.1 IS3 family transposase [Alkalihalobacillus sp. LMS39]
MRFRFIENHRSEFSVKKMCRVLEVSRSGYLKWRNHKPSKQEERKKAIQEKILFYYYDHHKIYGSTKITKKLQKDDGYRISERTVSNYMRELELRSCVSKKYKVSTTDSNHLFPIAPNKLNQQFTVSDPNKVWVTDITYIPCREGKLYLATVLDLYSREIVGWCLDRHMETKLVLTALDNAYEAKKPKEGLLHHSDRGTQYASHTYQERLQDYKMDVSMSRTGNCYDNACAESFFSLLKKELIQGKRFKTRAQAQTAIYRYIEFFYNRKRIHSSIGYVTPVEYAEAYYKNHTV